MKISKIRGLYFSGTGNTGKCVLTLAQKMSELLKVPFEAVNIAPRAVRVMDFKFEADELAIVGVPTYDGRVPKFLLPFFEQKITGSNTPTITLCTFGNQDYADSLIELRNLLQEKGFQSIAAAAIVGAHVLAPECGRQRPGNSDRRLLMQLSKKVQDKLSEEKPDFSKPVFVPGSTTLRPYLTPRDRYGYPINISKCRPKTKKEHYDTAPQCIKVCPVGAIAPDGVQIPGPCMRCGFCIKVSPEGAKYYDDESMIFYRKELIEQHLQPKKSEIFL